MLSVYLYKCTIHSNKNSSQTWLDSQVLLISSRNGELVPIELTACESCSESPKNSKPAGQVLLRETKLSGTLLHLLFKGGKEISGFHRKKKGTEPPGLINASPPPFPADSRGPVVYRKEVVAKHAEISELSS